MTNVVSPASFRHLEDEFLEFCGTQGVRAGRQDVAREDEGYREALRGTRSWRRNEFDLYVIFPTGLVRVDVKGSTDRNSDSDYMALELRAIRPAFIYDEPAIFVYAPDWLWLPARAALKADKPAGGCCDDCYALAHKQRWDVLHEKCPNRWGRGSGDPWVKYPKKGLVDWAWLQEWLIFDSTARRNGEAP